jgi:hypothetical protein
LVGTPYALLDWHTFWNDARYIMREYIGGQGYPESGHGLLFHWAHIAWFGIGPVAALLCLLGIGHTLTNARGGRRQPQLLQTLLLLFFLTAYSLLVLRARRLGDHLTLPVISPLAAFAGAGAASTLNWLRTRDAHPLIARLLMGATVAIPVAYSFHYNTFRSRLDTRELAQQWITTTIHNSEHIHLVGPYNVPLDPMYYTTTQDFGHRYQTTAQIRENGAGVVVVSDAVSFLYNSAEPYIPSTLPAYVRDELDSYAQTLQEIARFERPRWLGDNWPLNTASYFHNPALTVYCFPEVCDNIFNQPPIETQHTPEAIAVRNVP